MADDTRNDLDDAGSPGERLDDLIESVSDAFYAVGPDWRLVAFNRAAETFFGFARADVLGRSLWELFPAGRDNDFGQACQRAMDKGEVSQFQALSAFRPDPQLYDPAGPEG